MGFREDLFGEIPPSWYVRQQQQTQEMLNRMRQEGERYPNLGEADRRLRHRKHVESRVIETKQIQGAVKDAQEKAK